MMKYTYLLYGFAIFATFLLIAGAAYAESGSDDDESDDSDDDSSDDDSDDSSDDSDDGNTSTSDIVPEDDSDDLLEYESELDDDISGKTLRATIGFYGHGYALQGETGTLLSLVGVHKAAISVREGRTSQSFTRATLRVGKEEYKLTRTVNALEEQLPINTITFTVIDEGDVIGALTLNAGTAYTTGFAVRTGTLMIGEASWDVTIATQVRAIKGNLERANVKALRPSTADVDSVKDATIPVEATSRRGFWTRLFGREDRSGSNSGSN
ncbi:MAG: hypothetical protein AABX53_04125 [Nanoarchaeota archaeon]